MAHRIFKTYVLQFLAVVIAILLIVFSKNVSGKRITVWYIQSDNPSACVQTNFLPAGCVQFVKPNFCTTTVGSATRTYYQNSGCTVPFYRQ